MGETIWIWLINQLLYPGITIWVPIIKDIVIIISTAVTAYFVIRGFDSWKKQTEWVARNEIAESLMSSAYEFETAIKMSRSVNSISSFLTALKIINTKEFFFDNIDAAQESSVTFKHFLNKTNTSLYKFESFVPKAKIRYGPEIAQITDRFSEKIKQLDASFQEYLEYMRFYTNNDYPIEEFDQEILQIIVAPMNGIDMFANEVNLIITDLYNVLKDDLIK